MHLLHLHLDLPLRRSEIGQLRGAIAERAGWERDLFHNHADGRADRYRYRYPLIQYQTRQGRATLVGLDAGALALRELLDPAGNTFCGDLPVYAWREESFPLAMSERPRPYVLRQWLALNTANFARWQALRDEEARRAELERILTAHLLAFAEGAGFTVPRPRGLEVQLDAVASPHLARCHDGRLLSFDISFRANMLLPPGVGIGKAASHGFGTLWPATQPSPQTLPRRRPELFENHLC